MMEALEKLFIRPARHKYSIKDLGAPRFSVGGREVHRQDITLRNKLSRKIEASVFRFQQLQDTDEIIIYLHCNSGSRMEGIAHAKQVLEAGYAFMVFDFSGSGLSEGEYITLGVHQSEDLACVVSYLRDLNSSIKIVLWGRSMGAVASILYLQKHHQQISVAILDSPFSSLKDLALHIGTSQTSIPKFMLEGFIRILNNHLKERTKLDLISKLNVERIVDGIHTPGLFVGSKKDTLVPFRHIEQLYAQYAGYKQIYYLDQDHHQRRSHQTVTFILKFISRHIINPCKMHKKTMSNLSTLLNKPKHSVSQLDFRVSLQPSKKIQLITRSARRRENIEIRPSRGYQTKGKQNQKKRFIHLTEKNSKGEEDRHNYASESVKLLRNQTEIFNHNSTWKREPIKLCKRPKPKDKDKDRTPLKDITRA